MQKNQKFSLKTFFSVAATFVVVAIVAASILAVKNTQDVRNQAARQPQGAPTSQEVLDAAVRGETGAVESGQLAVSTMDASYCTDPNLTPSSTCWKFTCPNGCNADGGATCTLNQVTGDCGSLSLGSDECGQIDVVSTSGQYCQVTSVNCNCAQKTPSPTPTPVTPTGTLSVACTPGQKFSADGSLLSYTATVSNVNPSANFERTNLFLSFNGNDLTTAQEQSFEATFSNPNWATGNNATTGKPTCVNQPWCGYWLTANYTYAPFMNMVWDNSQSIGANGRPAKMKELVAWGAANGITTFKIDAGLLVNTVPSGGIGAKTVVIKPDACALPIPPSPTPTKVPSPTPTKVVSPTPTPTKVVSPTPTPSKIVSPTPTPLAPMCLNITMSSVNNPPKIGDSVNFTCGEVAGATSYQFRVIEPSGATVSLSATGRVSEPYRVTQGNTHYAQCRICIGNACQEWEPVNGNNSGGGNPNPTNPPTEPSRTPGNTGDGRTPGVTQPPRRR